MLRICAKAKEGLPIKTPKTTKAVLFILLQSIFYGFGNPLTKTAYESITPFWFLSFRFTIAFLIFMLFFGRSILNELKRAGPAAYLPAGFCMAGAYISCNLALSMTSATNVGFLMSLPVIFAPILARIILRQIYDYRHLPIQCAVVVGLLLLCMDGGSFSFGQGEVFGLLTALCAAGALVFGKKSLDGNLSVVTISAAQAGVTACISLLGALLFDNIHTVAGILPAAWIIIFYLALFCTCFAYVMQNLALTWSSPSLVSILQCSQPILTAVAAYFLLGETLSFIGLIGAAIIIICTCLESYVDNRT